MENFERLLKGTLKELDRLLNAKNVLGRPIEKGDATVIPIVSYWGGDGADVKTGEGAGTGTGDGIKPLGAIIIDQRGPLRRCAGLSGLTTAARQQPTAAGRSGLC